MRRNFILDKSGKIKLGVGLILISLILVTVLVGAFNVEESYYLGDDLRVDLRGKGNYTARFFTPSKTLLKEGSNDLFLYELNELGKYEIRFKFDEESENYFFEVVEREVKEEGSLEKIRGDNEERKEERYVEGEDEREKKNKRNSKKIIVPNKKTSEDEVAEEIKIKNVSAYVGGRNFQKKSFFQTLSSFGQNSGEGLSPFVKLNSFFDNSSLVLEYPSNYSGNFVNEDGKIKWKSPQKEVHFYEVQDNKENNFLQKNSLNSKNLRYVNFGAVDLIEMAAYYELPQHTEMDSAIFLYTTNEDGFSFYGTRDADKDLNYEKIDLPIARFRTVEKGPGSPVIFANKEGVFSLDFYDRKVSENPDYYLGMMEEAYDKVLGRYNIELRSTGSVMYYMDGLKPKVVGRMGLDGDYIKLGFYLESPLENPSFVEGLRTHLKSLTFFFSFGGLKEFNQSIDYSFGEEIVQEFSKNLGKDLKNDSLSVDEEKIVSSLKKELSKESWTRYARGTTAGDSIDKFEVELILNEKSSTNVFEYSLGAENLEFYYQPKLSENELVRGDFRSEEYLDSYSVYSGNKKVFHIYRPLIIDSLGKEVWGEMEIDEEKNLLRIIVPENFLENASYPVRVDPTFGYETAGGSTAILSDNIRGSVLELSEGGIVKNISAYLTIGKNTDAVFKFAIYDDSNSLVGYTSEGSASGGAYSATTNWYTLSLVNEVALSSGNYTLVAWGDITGGSNDVEIYFDSGSAGQGQVQSASYVSSFPSTLSASSENRIYSIYAGYDLPTMSVSLNSPSDGFLVGDYEVDFSYTPTSDTNFYNCSLWDNSTGSFALREVNSSSISSGSQNLLEKSYSSDGSYLWNVMCCSYLNGCSFATSNYTFEIEIPPRIGLDLLMPSGNINANQNEFFKVSLNVSCFDTDCGNINVTLDPIQESFEDFESGEGSFTHGSVSGGADAWHRSSEFSNDGSYSFKMGDTGTGNYPDDSNSYLQTPVYDMNENSTFSFYHYVDTETDYDGGKLEYMINESGTWNKVTSFVSGGYNGNINNWDDIVGFTNNEDVWDGTVGSSSSFSYVEADLSSFGFGNVTFRWRFVSDTNTNAEGWYVDSINFTSDFPSGNKGIIPVGSGTPFYTNKSSNPYTISLNEGQSEVVDFFVNATGLIDTTYEFFAYANVTSNPIFRDMTDKWNVTIVEKTSPIVFYSSDGINQVSFNNIGQNSKTPAFNLGFEGETNLNLVQIELNKNSSFEGTSYIQNFSGNFIPGERYNFLTNNLFPNFSPGNEETYYVRARASSNLGEAWSVWSTKNDNFKTWSYTYKNYTVIPNWFQQQKSQFDTGSLNGVFTNSTDQVYLLKGEDLRFIDFSEYTTNEQPFDWTHRWSTSNHLFEIIADSSAIGGKLLRKSGTGIERTLLSWDLLDGSDDIEILTKHRFSGVSGQIDYLFLRASGISGSETAYHSTYLSGTIYLLVRSLGSLISSDQSTTFTINANSWYWTRMRAEGENIYLKIWQDGNPEPSSWTLSEVSSDISNGWAGVGSLGERTADYDIFGVGLNGEEAPSSEINGTILSPEINFSFVPNQFSWEKAILKGEPSNGTIKLQILDSQKDFLQGKECNFSGEESFCEIDLSSVNPGGTNSSIYLKAILINERGSPSINNWTVTWGSEISPQVSLLTSGGSWFNSSNVFLEYHVYDSNDNIANSILIINNSFNSYNQTSILNNENNSFTVNLGEGIYSWTVNVSDQTSLVGTDFSRIFYVDSTAPEINLISPIPSGEYSSREIEFIANVTDNLDNSLDCELFLNNELKSSFEAVSSQNTSTSVSNLNEGTYFWNITCYDEAGNSKTSETRNFSIGDYPPTIFLITENNSNFNSSEVVLFYNASDNDFLSKAELYLNGTFNQSNQTVLLNGINNFTLVLNEGVYSWKINVTDSVGMSALSEERFFVVDYTSPSIVLNLPEDEKISNDSSINFNFTAIDNLASSFYCNFYINENNYSNILVENNTLENLFLESLSDGIKNWNVTCWDNAGNSKTSENRALTVSEYPFINLTTKNNTYFNSTNIFLKYFIEDNGPIKNCDLYLNGAFNQSNQSSINNGEENQFNLTSSSGIYSWKIICEDNYGLITESEERIFGIDDGSPFVELIFPASGDGLKTALVNFTFNVTDNLDELLLCNFTVNGEKFGPDNFSNGTLSSKEIYFEEGGLKFWNVTCFDNAENSFTSETRNFTLEFAPLVNLSFPQNNSFLNSSSINLTYFVFDYNDDISNSTLILNEVTYLANQSIILNGENNSFNLLNLEEGYYNWSVNVFDNSNLNGTSETFNFALDFSKPNISIVSPENETIFDWNEIYFNFSVSDNFPENLTCSLIINGTNEYEDVIVEEGVLNSFNASLSDGDYNWQILCNDLAGNSQESEVRDFSIDAPPRVNLINPLNNFKTKESTMEFIYLPEDAIGIQECSLFLDGVLNKTSELLVINNNNSFFVEGISEGKHNWTVECIDADSNSFSPLPYDFIRDLSPPEVVLDAPLNESGIDFNSGQVSFRWKAVDALDNFPKCDLIVGGNVEANDKLMTNNSFTTEIVSGLSFGEHYWNVSCWDSVNNLNYSETRTFNFTYPDFFVNDSSIVLNDSEIQEGEAVLVNVTIDNIGYADSENVLVQFYQGNPSSGGIQFGENQTVNIGLNDSLVVSEIYSPEIGLNEIYVVVDQYDEFTEFDEGNNFGNKNVSVGAWQFFYGNMNKESKFSLAGSGEIVTWNISSFERGSIFVADSESVISWNSLTALGKDLVGGDTGDDYSNVDSLLSMTGFEDSINNLYLGEETNFSVFGKIIDEVPITNSTNNSNFVTGILWDGEDDSGNQEFDVSDSEDLVFVTKLNENSQGAYGVYDYELRVPAKLREYAGEESEVVFYVELF